MTAQLTAADAFVYLILGVFVVLLVTCAAFFVYGLVMIAKETR